VTSSIFTPPHLRDETLAALHEQLATLQERSPFYADLYGREGVDPQALGDLGDLGKLPFVEKAMLRDSQAASPPLGAHAAVDMSDVIRVHASTGTTGTPSWVGVTRRDSDTWTEIVAAGLRTQGLGPDDVVVHGAGLTLFVGGLPFRDAIERIGATMVPVGTGASEKAVLAMERLGVTALHSTPSYARYLAEHIRTKVGKDPRDYGLRKIIVGGEPGGGEPAFRQHMEREWGAVVTEGLGNADMSPLVFAEKPGTAGMRFVAGKHIIAELIDPESGDLLGIEPGVEGELVYTGVTREACPLVRFRTRDRVKVTGVDTDGTPMIRCIGRTDDMLIVLGVNVFPSAIRDVVQAFQPRVSGALQVVLDSEPPKVDPPLRVEVEVGADPGDRDELRARLEGRIRDRLSVSAKVSLVPLESLARSEMKTTLTRIDGRP
jgi:phenylacetate-CoA ligase